MNLPRILIITAIRNEEHSLSLYLKSLHDLEYPKNLIDLYWLENDSTDRTLEILEKAKDCATLPYAMLFGFNSIILETINILGPVKKGKCGGYWKDIPYGSGRLKSWRVIWDKYFLSIARKSTVDYVIWTCADCIAPPNVISEYLKVFELKKDAGWVAGAIYRRYPRHESVRCPMPFSFLHSKQIVAVDYVGHWIMMPRSALAKAKFWVADAKLASRGGGDIHMSLVKSFCDQGLKVYYQPSVFLKHISTDGKIYTHEIIKK